MLIVESPTKAKTIQKFLDESKFKVFSSQGHIREIKSILPENDFEIKYRFTKSGEAITYQLKKEKSQSSNVILASDKDRYFESFIKCYSFNQFKRRRRNCMAFISSFRITNSSKE